jgi:putative phosphoribosyl transferase
MRFRDRAEAGSLLGELVAARDLAEPIVLALPRGGVPVGAEVASRIGAPLDVYVARKIGAPHQPEYGVGAIAEGGTVVSDPLALEVLGLDHTAFEALVERERSELRRRVALYRSGRTLPPLSDHDVVLVDDGLATGVTAEAAVLDLRQASARSIVLAVPVGARDTVERLSAVADAVLCVESRRDLVAVGRWYRHFDQTSDDEVLEILSRARSRPPT